MFERQWWRWVVNILGAFMVLGSQVLTFLWVGSTNVGEMDGTRYCPDSPPDIPLEGQGGRIHGGYVPPSITCDIHGMQGWEAVHTTYDILPAYPFWAGVVLLGIGTVGGAVLRRRRRSREARRLAEHDAQTGRR
ncbi:hypothetical protein [Brevibacterium litoralis]|uniref:hypothetical protein n=1 Tax=Brevibacterium litoralis TaxID=3138935 RepID=UPI0032EE2742